MATVGVVVVTYRSAATIDSCLQSLRGARTSDVPIVVVDNASDDDSAQRAEAHGATVIRRATNGGYGVANNEGVRALPPDIDWVLFANPDTDWPRESLDALINEAGSEPHIGLISPTLVGEDGTPQAFVEDDFALGAVVRGMTRLGPPIRPRVPHGANALLDVASLHTAAALVPMSVVTAVRGFDEQFFLFAEDADFCRRIRAQGKRVVVTPRVRVTHIGGTSVAASADSDQAAALRTRALATYIEKYQGRFARRVFGLVGTAVYGVGGHRGQAREAWKAVKR